MNLKSITKFLTLAPLFLIPFFPLIVTNSFFFPFITGKAFYFRILVEVAFLAWIVLAFLDAKYRPKWNALTVGVTAFTIITLVADLLGANPIRSLWSNFERMEGWIVIVHLWMFYMVAVHAFGIGDAGKKLWHSWLNTSIVASFIVACYGLVQYFGWTAIHQSSTRVDASLGNAEYMAVYMLISAGFAVYLLFESKIRRAVKGIKLSGLEWVYAVLAVLYSFILVETGTRGTTLGLIGAIMLTLFLYAIFAGKENKKSRIISGVIIIFIIALGSIFWIEKDSKFVQSSPALSRIATITLADIQTQGRAYIWPMAVKGAIERPVLGWGQENFNYIFNANYNPKMWNQEQWFDRAHSVYLDWLVAGGFVGLFAYLALYVLFLMSVWKSSLNIVEKSALTGLLAGYAVHNIFVFDNLASYVMFFALLGLAASLKKTDTVKTAKVVSSEVIEYIVAPLAIIILIAGIYMFNVRPIQENTRLITALQSCGGNTGALPDATLFNGVFDVNAYVGLQETREQILSCAGNVINSQQIPNPTKQAFFSLAMKAITGQVAATPKDARVYTLAGSFLEQIGAFQQALPLLEKAHTLSPEKQTISFALGTAYVNLGQSDKAVALLKQTYDSETSNTDAENAYLTTLIAAGHDADAQKLFGADQSLFNTEQVAQAYAIAKQYDKAISIYQNIIGTSTDQINTQFRMAQTQYSAGYISQAVATLNLIEVNHPEYKTQLDAAIKQVQTPK